MPNMRKTIKKILERTVDQKDIFFEVNFSEKKHFGHYSTNIAFCLAKKSKKIPLEIANELSLKIKLKNKDLFEKIEVVPPGFINFWLPPKIFYEELVKILVEREKYGRKKKNKKKIKTQVEFISANPTGPLTLANGRGGFLGDVIANVLEWTGKKVKREYYVNDAGNQIVNLGKSILAEAGVIKKEEDFYKGSYIKKWAFANKNIVFKHKENFLKLGQIAAGYFLKTIKKVVEEGAKIRFDRFTSEFFHIYKKGYTKKALSFLKSKGLTYKQDGALWLKTSVFGDEKDRVIVTGEGVPAYILGDAGYVLEIKNRGFNHKINILGPDHHGYVKRLKAVAEILSFKNYEIIITQAIRIVENGKEMKMSKRKGEFITFEELINEVGADVARFLFLMVAPSSHIDFDLKLAKERSMKNPVFYVQYAYVRALNIIKKVTRRTKPMPIYNRFKSFKAELLNSEADLELIRKLVQFPEIVEEVSENYQVHKLTQFGRELARAFHNFYEKERVIEVEELSGGEELKRARLALVWATKIVLENLFKILGISAPDKM